MVSHCTDNTIALVEEGKSNRISVLLHTCNDPLQAGATPPQEGTKPVLIGVARGTGADRPIDRNALQKDPVRSVSSSGKIIRMRQERESSPPS